MDPFRGRAWMYLAVTVVSLLIWFWAAGETRVQTGVTFTVQLVSSDPARWLVSPGEITVSAELEGSRFAIQDARNLKSPLKLTHGVELPMPPGIYPENLAELLEQHEPLADTGVGIKSTDPPSIDISVDALSEVTLPVQVIFPNIQTEGEVKREPAEAVVRLPGSVRAYLPEDLVIEAVIDPRRLQEVEPGQTYKLQATLRVPERYGLDESILIMPPTVTVEFTVRSQIKVAKLASVRVQIAGPPEDYDEYVVQIDEKDRTLRDVVVKADGPLMQQIERGDVRVVALVHLSNSDKERRVETKPITCFLAILPTGTGRVVDAEMADGTPPREIRLKITDRTP